MRSPPGLLSALLVLTLGCLRPAMASAAPPRLDPVNIVIPVVPEGAMALPDVPEPPETLPDGRVRLILFDFGPDKQDLGNRISFGTRVRNDSWGWMGGMVRSGSRDVARAGPYLADFVEGEDARFVLAVDPPDSDYEVHLTLGDADSARGPIDILLGDTPIL